MSIRGPDGRVGILLQKDHLFEWRTVLENAELGLEIRGRKPPRRAAEHTSYSNPTAWPASRTHIRISSPAACVSAWR